MTFASIKHDKMFGGGHLSATFGNMGIIAYTLTIKLMKTTSAMFKI